VRLEDDARGGSSEERRPRWKRCARARHTARV
jgi:hypothetical protein